MENIALAGYITDEKMHIARDYLEKSTREDCAIKPEQVEVKDNALLALIDQYCREAGVRNLQKQIEKIYRKVALKLVRGGASHEPSPAHELHPAVIVEQGVQLPSITSNDVSSKIVEDDQFTDLGDGLKESTEASSTEFAAVSEATSHEHTSEIASDLSEKANSDELVEATIEDAPVQSIISLNNAASIEQPIDSQVIDIGTENSKEPTDGKVVEKLIIDESNLSDYVGKPVFHAERIYDQTPVGVAMGLAWTAMGGSTLYIETSLVEQGDGKGALILTGQLGDVMKESAQIAHTVARAILLEKEPENPFFANTKLHLHVPAGATPKDGPSAGCTMITSMLSLANKKLVEKDLAMTGEVTLTGRILPIGGVKEKTIAARRSGVKTIIFPSANKRDFDELAADIKEGLDVHFVDTYSQIYDIALASDHSDIAFGSDQSSEKGLVNRVLLGIINGSLK